MVVGSSVLMAVWLAVGVVGVVAGLLWLRGSERARRTSAVTLSRPSSTPAAAEPREPDALAG